MIRAFLGFAKGLLVGGGIGYGLYRLGLGADNPILTYLACTLVGALVGVICGRAPWRSETIWTPVVKAIFGGAIGGTNALASSIVLVCRPRVVDAPMATRREFVSVLKTELPQALAHLQRGNIAPVDLAQAAIGPGMAVYTRYAKVLDAEGKPLSVREALALINQTLDEALAEHESAYAGAGSG